MKSMIAGSEIIESSDNVFKDLGFDNYEELKAKAELARQIAVEKYLIFSLDSEAFFYEKISERLVEVMQQSFISKKDGLKRK